MEDQMQQQEQQPEEMEQGKEPELPEDIKKIVKEEEVEEVKTKIKEGKITIRKLTPEEIQEGRKRIEEFNKRVETQIPEVIKDAKIYSQLEKEKAEELKELRKLSLTEISTLPEEEKALYWGTLLTKAADLCSYAKTVKEAIPEAEEYPQEAARDILSAAKDVNKSIIELLDILKYITAERHEKNIKWGDNLEDEIAKFNSIFQFLAYSVNLSTDIDHGTDKILKSLETLSSVLPSSYVIPNNKLANRLASGDIIDEGQIILDEASKGAKKSIETTCILTYEGDNIKLSGRQAFTEYDRNVYNAISSLYVYGDQSHIFTPAQIYRTMTGLGETEKPTKGQLLSVTRSLDKMRFIRAKIDCTEELKARRITLNSQQINSGEIDTYLLAAEAIKVKAGGQIVNAYKIIKSPILFEYSAAVKQVLTLPLSTLDVKDINANGSIGTRLPNTETRILIKGYLLRRIEGMKGNNSLNSKTIALYDSTRNDETRKGLYSIIENAKIYNQLGKEKAEDGKEKAEDGKEKAEDGKESLSRTEMSRIRNDAEIMLTYWSKTGYIKGYKKLTRKTKVTGYEIIL